MDRKLFRSLGLGAALAAGLTAGAAGMPRPAHACGGFFCSSANPVNQTAERIIFAQNADDTVTAVIQIMYEGPADRFAWVLPVPGVPDVKVSSDQAFDALQATTNPLYQLNTVFGGSCGMFMSPVGSGAAGAAAPSDSDSGGGVTVLASGAIGPYNYETIMVDPAASDPAQVAVDWLAANDYDLGEIGAEVLRPYLEQQLNLIAFKLQKGNSSGSIRPVMLTYESALPSIPIRPTAVAANDDMGVMVFTLSDARAIPENYKALELNEALIDWFNPNNNYNEVVSRAADEAMGQGFVTEYADTTQNLINNSGFSIFPPWQEQAWSEFSATPFASAAEMVQKANANWGGWDGLNEALQGAVMLPDTISFDDFQRCINCYINAEGVVFNQTMYLTNIYEDVIKPMLDTQALFESRPYMTRLYTTMSADEMTVDPVFDFNPDLDPVSNQHFADRTIECNSTDPFGQTGPWSVELPQGDVVRGTEFGVWPIEIDSMPAALKIIQYGTSGQGRIIEDRSRIITDMMNEGGSSGGTAGSGSGGRSGGTAGSGSGDDEEPGPAGEAGATASDDEEPGDGAETQTSDSSGCSAVAGGSPGSLSFIALALAALIRRRNRRR